MIVIISLLLLCYLYHYIIVSLDHYIILVLNHHMILWFNYNTIVSLYNHTMILSFFNIYMYTWTWMAYGPLRSRIRAVARAPTVPPAPRRRRVCRAPPVAPPPWRSSPCRRCNGRFFSGRTMGSPVEKSGMLVDWPHFHRLLGCLVQWFWMGLYCFVWFLGISMDLPRWRTAMNVESPGRSPWPVQVWHWNRSQMFDA